VNGRPAGTQVRCRCGTTFEVPEGSHIGELSCPNCGAALSPDDPSCPYCRTALALAACPRCFGRVFQGNGFCPHCGAAIDVTARASPEGLDKRLCPRCLPEVENHLVAHLVGDTLLDECRNCGGLWVDRPAFERVVQDRQRQAALLSTGLENAPPAHARAVELPPVRYLGCPDCKVLMNRKNFAGRSGVVVEVCKPHGIWFDRDQLSAVLRFVMAGGLERTQRQELEEKAAARSLSPANLPHAFPSPALDGTGLGIGELGELVVNALRRFFG